MELRTKSVVTKRGEFILTKIEGNFSRLTDGMTLHEAVDFVDNSEKSYNFIVISRSYSKYNTRCYIGMLDKNGESVEKNELLWMVERI